jgi:hypothetical protein
VATYLQSVTEENLHLAVQYRVWGSKINKISDWKRGDTLIVYVERALAAQFEITSEPFYDERFLWQGDVYPYRVNIELQKIVRPEDRHSMGLPDIRAILHDYHSRSYGVPLVLAARPLADEAAHVLLKHLEEPPDWDDYNPVLILAALNEQSIFDEAEIDEAVIQADDLAGPEEPPQPSLHTEMQYLLARLGRSLRFEVWIPKSDRKREYGGQPLGELSVAELPPLPFNDDALRIIRNIDVIWLQEGHPTHLFEVEHTTSVYSGLLRMSDLAMLIPSLNITMFICAKEERRDKVRAEVNRPTFDRQPTPLAARCRFIAFDRLASFMAAQQDYLGYFSTAILDELSESLVR